MSYTYIFSVGSISLENLDLNMHRDGLILNSVKYACQITSD